MCSFCVALLIRYFLRQRSRWSKRIVGGSEVSCDQYHNTTQPVSHGIEEQELGQLRYLRLDINPCDILELAYLEFRSRSHSCLWVNFLLLTSTLMVHCRIFIVELLPQRLLSDSSYLSP